MFGLCWCSHGEGEGEDEVILTYFFFFLVTYSRALFFLFFLSFFLLLHPYSLCSVCFPSSFSFSQRSFVRSPIPSIPFPLFIFLFDDSRSRMKIFKMSVMI